MFATKVPPCTDDGPTALDLLTEIALLKEAGSDADFDRAETLFVQLLSNYERYFRALAGTLMPFDGSTVRFDTDDLYSELAIAIWTKAHQFNPRDTAPAAVRKQFFGWGAAILKNIVRDKLGPLQLFVTDTEATELGWDEFEGRNPEPSKRAEILGEILEEMDPEDAEIIRWSGLSIPLDGTQMRTDPAERALLCRKLNVTPAGLRKRRERALKALKEEFERRSS